MSEERRVFWTSKKSSKAPTEDNNILDHQWRRSRDDEPLEAIFHALSDGQKFVKVFLGGNHLGDEGAVAVVSASLEVPTLTQLDLYFNQITAVGASGIADLLSPKDTDEESAVHALSHLNLGYNDLESEGAHHMARMLRNQHTMKFLGLSHNDIKNSGGEELREALRQNASLQSLNLKGNPMDAAIIDQINVALSYNSKVAAANRGSASPT